MRYLLGRLTRNSLERRERGRGGQGDAPLGLPPPPGREGVTLIASAKCKKIGAATGFLLTIFFIFPPHQNL